MAGGGVHGKVVCIAHGIMTGDGLIMTVSQLFILMWTRVGEDITETIIGTNTVGTTNGFLARDFNRTGRAGMIIDTGEEKEPGVSRTIEFHHNNKSRNGDIKENRNITGGPRFRNISSGEKGSKGKENIRAEKKAKRKEVRGDTMIRSNDI